MPLGAGSPENVKENSSNENLVSNQSILDGRNQFKQIYGGAGDGKGEETQTQKKIQK